MVQIPASWENAKSGIENVVSSDEISVTSGVGQGSNLGRLLFLIYINDIKYSVQHSKFLLFADDLKLYKCIKTYDDYIMLQNDLSSVNTFIQFKVISKEQEFRMLYRILDIININ